MACFLVPTAEAVVTTAVEKHIEKKEAALPEEERAAKAEFRIPFRTKLKWLNTMLIGGAVFLAFEHLWHGEIVPFFPFLTATLFLLLPKNLLLCALTLAIKPRPLFP